MPASVIAVAEADVEMVSLDTRAERQRQLIRHAQELHHLNLAAARQGLRERTAQADTAKVSISFIPFFQTEIPSFMAFDCLAYCCCPAGAM